MKTTEDAARQAAGSASLRLGARVGLAARGLVYVLIGVLAGKIAAGGSERADQQGALQKISEQPFGNSLLWLVTAGFVAYGLWRLGEAAWGRRDEIDEKKRLVKRVESLASGLFYLLLAALALRFATGGGSGSHDSLTLQLLDAPGGRMILTVIGLVVVGVGVGLAWRGINTDFEKQLTRTSMSSQTYGLVRRLGQVGYVARGAVFAFVGVLVVEAALDHDPGKAGGLDVALHRVASAPHGVLLLSAAAAGLVSFGAYSCAEVRYRRL